jgi:2-keto-4-pentenoate hydratase/2-oxohepta-3-ene-1,7-dioic acid hydratase in catechol pathway
MKFCRFVPLSAREGKASQPAYGILSLNSDRIREISGTPWLQWSETNNNRALKDVRLLAPCEPGKILCIGRNYAAHAAELGNPMPKEPMLFMKPSSAMIGPEEAIVLPVYSQRVEHEAELTVVMGKKCAHLDDNDDPLAYIFGYTCLNDVTARDLQKTDGQFTRAKGFDTFCPVGPCIETQLDPHDVLVECRVNGQIRQSGSTALMAYPVAFLVRWISRMMTLFPGDLIATGTPAGVGQLVAGDRVEVSAAGVGVLRNPVHASKT